MASPAWPSLGLLAACCGNAVKVWDPNLDGGSSGFRETRMTDDRRILSCAWNQSGKVLAYGGESGRITMRNHNSVLLCMPQRCSSSLPYDCIVLFFSAFLFICFMSSFHGREHCNILK